MNNNTIRKLSETLPRLILAAIILGICAACSGTSAIKKYSEARHAFNTAAELENGIKLRGAFPLLQINADRSSNPLSITPDLVNANKTKITYQESLALLQSINASNEAELEKNGMLMDKLTLEALCLLRLKRYAELESVINHARRLSEKQKLNVGRTRSRDSYLMQALPGLIMNDQAYAKIPENIDSNTPLFEEIEKMIVGPGEHAVQYLRSSRKAAVKNNHPVKTYLMQAELAAYRNLMGAYTACKPERANKPNRWGQSEAHKKTVFLLKCLKDMDQTPEKVVFRLWWTSFGQPIMDDEVMCGPEN